MPRSPFAVLGVASLAAVSLLLAGCSSPDGTGGDGKLSYEDSPLAQYTNAMYGGDRDNDDYIAEANAAEELIATCMAEEGFDYVPVDQSQYYSFDEFDAEERETEEWVAANGYGYNLTDEQQAEQNEQWEDFVDPNQDYLMSLSEAEQTAYYEVLQGPQPTEEEMSDPDFVYQQLGCQGEANLAVRGEEVYNMPEFKDIVEAMGALWEKQQEHAAVVAVNAAWSACMADAGHPDLANKDAVWEVMNAQNEEAWSESEGAELSAEKRAEMREFELDLALADFHCAEELDYTQVVLAAQYELEEQFIKDNKAELDAMLAAASQE